MKILDLLKINKNKNTAKLEYENPYGERFTYINDIEKIRRMKIREYKVWYSGDSSEIMNFYTNQITYGFDQDPIYNRNSKEYFWSIASSENGFKRVHSGVPNAVINTLCNIVGYPTIKASEYEEELNEILKANNFSNILNQEQLPLTLVCGEGAFKVNFDKDFSEFPIISFYDAEKVRFHYYNDKLIGITFIDYYEKEKKQYTLLETRRIDKNNSYIEYELFDENDKKVPLSILNLPFEDIVIENYHKIVGVESKIFYDPLNQRNGRSIFVGKIDLFDELDLILSQASQTTRVSTPIEYFNPEILERSPHTGESGLPKVFNRQYIRKYDAPDGDGKVDNDIQITQPEIRADEYGKRYIDVLKTTLTGILAPASLGVDVSLRDNAKAQREKEKTTIFMRQNILQAETVIIRKLCEIILDINEYMQTGKITNRKYDISVNFDKFANPTFEEEIAVLGNALSQGQISPIRYVNSLWGDSLSDEDKEKEITYLEEFLEKDNVDLSNFEGDNPYNEARANKDSEEQSEDTKDPSEIKDTIYHENI